MGKGTTFSLPSQAYCSTFSWDLGQVSYMFTFSSPFYPFSSSRTVLVCQKTGLFFKANSLLLWGSSSIWVEGTGQVARIHREERTGLEEKPRHGTAYVKKKKIPIPIMLSRIELLGDNSSIKLFPNEPGLWNQKIWISSWLQHLLAMETWENYWNYLRCSSFIYKVGVIT